MVGRRGPSLAPAGRVSGSGGAPVAPLGCGLAGGVRARSRPGATSGRFRTGANKGGPTV